MDTNTTTLGWIVRHKRDTEPYHEYEVVHHTYKEALEARDTVVAYAGHYGTRSSTDYTIIPIIVDSKGRVVVAWT
jgi:hypothetical protein